MSDRMAEVLVDHQRKNASSCHCGWAELGKSHPAHQAAALTAAGFGDVREAKAQGWDAAAGSLVYPDGSKVEVASNINPYHAALEATK